jgi:hypothetical protein
MVLLPLLVYNLGVDYEFAEKRWHRQAQGAETAQ